MASNYNFENLSPIEFESVVADILGEEANARFEVFSAGADGGIDARCKKPNGDIILQAKHYKGSTWNDLLKAAKSESQKINQLNPIEYFFVTSQGLSVLKKKKIIEALNLAPSTIVNILGREDLNFLLKKHPDVEKRNLKLWLSSTAVLERVLSNDIAVFTEATKDKIERILKVFVSNPSISSSLDILAKNNCLIISGPPGVGKSTLAQVLTAQHIEIGWELVAVNSIRDARKLFRKDKKQIFIFDDFLGKISLNAEKLAKEDERIAGFLDQVSKTQNKRIILTTRKYILQSARKASEALDDEKIDLQELILDLSVYSKEIRAQILYNHLYHSNLPQAFINALVEENFVQRIINHVNYMPRIIEWMTEEFRFNDIKADQYPEKFISMLDRPHKIWEKAFKSHISSKARILLYCLFFLERTWGITNYRNNISVLEKFFDNALSKFGDTLDPSLPDERFRETIEEINSSFIVVNNQRVDFINPSVQDYLSSVLMDVNLLKTLASAVTSFEHARYFIEKIEREHKDSNGLVEACKKEIKNSILDGELRGKLRLDDLERFLRNLDNGKISQEMIAHFTNGKLSKHYWFSEIDSIDLIYGLTRGSYKHVARSQSFARWLRIRLYKFLVDRDDFVEIEHLVELADNVYFKYSGFPEYFAEAFETAAFETVQALELRDVEHLEDSHGQVSEWLEQMNKLESYFGYCLNASKKYEFEEHLYQAELRYQEEMERYDHSLLRRTEGNKVGNLDQSTQNESMNMVDMFNSLKK